MNSLLAKVVDETPPEINQQSLDRLYINRLLEFASGGFVNHQGTVYTNCSLEF
jgi:hypothetical protein